MACRNILLFTDNVVKICDFGLSKEIYNYGEYVRKTNTPLPIKWMAIESLKYNICTTKSDVWSFGIFMWELFSLGETPYPGIEIDENFIEKLSNGYRMNKPDYCPENIFTNIVEKCWNVNPVDRPNFNELYERIGNHMETGVHQYYVDLNEQYFRMNQLPLNVGVSNEDYLNMSA